MAMQSKVGSFNTGTGAIGTTVVVNDVGFQPKVVLFWWNGRTGTTDASGRANHQRGFGVGVSSSDRRFVTSLSQDTPTSMVTNTMQGNAQCIGITTTADAIDGLMDVQSMDSGGFTLVVDDVFTASYRIHYLALGGSDISNVVTGQFTGNAAGVTGNQDITSLAFQPNAIMVFSTGQTTANNTVRTDSRMMIGAAGGGSGVWAGGSNDGAGTSQAMSYCRSGELISLFNTGLTGLDDRATFSTFLSNGFRVNWSTVTTGGAIIFFLAINGSGHFLVDNLLTRTDGNNITESGFGFTPKAALLVSACKAADAANTPSDDDEWSMGAFTSASARVAMSVADDDAAATAIVSNGVSHDQVYQNLNANTGAVEGEMDVVSMDFDGFTLVMDDTDPAQAFVWYIAFGNAALTSSPSGGITPTGALSKQTNKTLAGSVTSAGSILKAAQKVLSGALSWAGNLVAQKLGTQFTQDLSGTLTSAGALLKATSKFFTGGTTPSGTVTKSPAKSFAGTVTSAGDLIKQGQKSLSGAISSIVGTLSTNRGYIRSFTGDITPTGTLTKTAQKLFTGAITSSGSLLKSIAKVLAGSVTSSGSITKQSNKSLEGTVTSSGSIAKSIGKILSGILSLAGDLGTALQGGAQQYFQSLSGSLPFSGALQKTTNKSLSGGSTPSGTVIKTINKAFSGAITLAGDISKSTSKMFSGALTSSGNVMKSIAKIFTGAITSAGSITKIIGKGLSGGLVPTGDVGIVRLFVKMLEGSMSLTGTLIKSVSKSLTGNISPLGTLNKTVSKFFSGVVTLAGQLTTLTGVVNIATRVYLLGSRITTVALTGARNRIAALRGRRNKEVNVRGSREDLN